MAANQLRSFRAWLVGLCDPKVAWRPFNWDCTEVTDMNPTYRAEVPVELGETNGRKVRYQTSMVLSYEMFTIPIFVYWNADFVNHTVRYYHYDH